MDVNVLAYRIVKRATEESPSREEGRRAASRKGGVRGGAARARSLSAERRSEIARKANAARWKKGSTE